MKHHLQSLALLAAAAFAGGLPALAQTAAPAAVPSRELTVVVVESLGKGTNRLDDFERIAIVFGKEFGKRKWPLKVNFERFADNLPDHDPELRVFFKGIYEETSEDLTFHAWVTLTENGAKHDFGMIKFRDYPRPGRDREDALEDVIRGAARDIADRIEPLLLAKKEAARQ